MHDKNGKEIKLGQEVRVVDLTGTNYLVPFDAEVEDIFEKTILVIDEARDFYEVKPIQVEVQL